MKVILLSDVSKIGRKYEVKDVSDGYGRNFLLKNRLAEIATPDVLKKVEDNKKRAEEEKNEKEKLAIQKINKLSDAGLIIDAEANKEGNLFAGIRREDVVNLFRNNGAGILEEYIVFDKPIKESGDKDILFKIGERNFKLKIKINPKK